MTIAIRSPITLYGNNLTDVLLSGQSPSDPSGRWTVDVAGTTLLGNGTQPPDVRMGRTNGAGGIQIDTNGSAQSSRLGIEATAGQRSLLYVQVAGEAQSRIALFGDATKVGIELGGGAAARDVSIERTGATQMLVSDNAGADGLGLYAHGIVVSRRLTAGSAAFATATNLTQTTNLPWLVAADGGMSWGDGTNPRDTRLRRTAAGQIVMDSSGTAATSFLQIVSTAGQRAYFGAAVSGDVGSRVLLSGDATVVGLELGPGNAVRDVRLVRPGAKTLQVDDTAGGYISLFRVLGPISGSRAATTDIALQAVMAGDSVGRLNVLAGGDAVWGSGTASDVRLRRSAAKTLEVDDTAGGAVTLNVIGALREGGTDVSLVGHGAADHADVTRSIMLTPDAAGLDGSSTLIVVGASPNLSRAVNYPDAATSGAFWWWYVPTDWASGVISIRPLWTPAATDAVAHTVRWSVTAAGRVSAGDITSAGTTTAFTGISAARTVNVQVVENLQSTGITPSATGARMMIELQRIGADAADTYVGAVRLLGLIVEYTASQ